MGLGWNQGAVGSLLVVADTNQVWMVAEEIFEVGVKYIYTPRHADDLDPLVLYMVTTLLLLHRVPNPPL